MPILRFENVTKQFDTDSFGVREINFSVDQGEFVFLTGPSGSGKTTLMRLLLKEYSFNTGEIFFHDNPLSSVKNSHVHLHRRRIGVVFQDYKLIPEMNIWENIAVPLWVTGKADTEVERRVTDLLNLIKLPEKALHFPSQLSGGEAQRVGIARALAIGPELVIADEPTGNLDPETAQNVARLLKKINELGTTVVIATHDKNILATYPETRKIALEKGTLVEDTKTGVSIKKTASTVKKDAENDEKVSETHHLAEQEKSHKHKEHHIAEDLIPEPVKPAAAESHPHSTDERPESNNETSKPSWWQKLFGSKKKTEPSDAVDQDDSDDHLEKPSDKKSEKKETEHSSKDDTDQDTGDDLVTITEESLDDDESLEESEKHSKKDSSHKPKHRDSKQKDTKAKK